MTQIVRAAIIAAATIRPSTVRLLNSSPSRFIFWGRRRERYGISRYRNISDWARQTAIVAALRRGTN